MNKIAYESEWEPLLDINAFCPYFYRCSHSINTRTLFLFMSVTNWRLLGPSTVTFSVVSLAFLSVCEKSMCAHCISLCVKWGQVKVRRDTGWGVRMGKDPGLAYVCVWEREAPGMVPVSRSLMSVYSCVEHSSWAIKAEQGAWPSHSCPWRKKVKGGRKSDGVERRRRKGGNSTGSFLEKRKLSDMFPALR